MNKTEKAILILLAMAQFILTLDSTVMNVSISTLVIDLNTTVTGIQSAITFYTLVMAALMIPGAKIGDIIGRKKAFIIGLLIYGTGSLITSLSVNLTMLIFGWSLLEGIGAALMIPAMLSLIASNYPEGPKRIKAYGTVAAIAAIGAAAGPIVGGFLTTYATWRLAFLTEVLVVIYILIKKSLIKDSVYHGKDKKLDIIGTLLSVTGLGLLVTGILQASTYGLIQARKPWVVNGKTLVEAGGLSPALILLSIGLLILVGFVLLEAHRIKNNKAVILDVRLLKNLIIKAGTSTIFFQSLLLGGLMYGVSLYTQMELGYSAMQTGLTLLPMSVMILLIASRGSIMATKFSGRTIVRVGLVLMLIGSAWLGYKAGKNPTGVDFIPCLALFGAGIGMMASQLQNLVQNSVKEKDSAQASGLMATFQYLGQSFGTAIAGVLIVSTLIFASTNLVNESSAFTDQQKTQINSSIEKKAQLASNEQVEAATSALPPEQSSELIEINAQARKTALSNMFILIAIISAFGILSTKNLPSTNSNKNQK